VATRTRNTVKTASEVLGPSVAQAVLEGQRAAREAAQDLEEELKKPPTTEKPSADTTNIAAEQA
jgi:hypothetical protein